MGLLFLFFITLNFHLNQGTKSFILFFVIENKKIFINQKTITIPLPKIPMNLKDQIRSVFSRENRFLTLAFLQVPRIHNKLIKML